MSPLLGNVSINRLPIIGQPEFSGVMSPLLGNVSINRFPIIEQPEFSVKRGPFLGYESNVIAVSTAVVVIRCEESSLLAAVTCL
jgi:hypothetical protein